VDCLLTMGIGLVGGLILGLSLPRADVAGLWTVIMALATVGLALASYGQIRTSSRSLEDNLRPFLIWSGYWQYTDDRVRVTRDLDQRTFLVKNTGRTLAKIIGVEFPEHCSRTELSEDDRLVSPHSEVPVVKAKRPYTGRVVVRYEGSTGTPYELLGDLRWIITAAEAKPRGRYYPPPEEKLGP